MASNIDVNATQGVNAPALARKFGIDRHRKYLKDEQANHLCKDIEELHLLRSLTELCDDLELTRPGFSSNDRFFSPEGTALFLPALRWLSTEGYDYAAAYYMASTIFMKVLLNPDQQVISASNFIKDVLDAVKQNQIEREKFHIRMDESRTEVIHFPYKTLPRRIWDIRSNRVIPFAILTIKTIRYNPRSRKWEVKFADLLKDPPPEFWAVSHSWAAETDSTTNLVNSKKWPVPLPHGISLDRVRDQLSQFGAHYVWLDVLCLRQYWAGSTDESEARRQQEWKLDVPTIGNIYRVATTIVRYFNGLGCDFSSKNWDDDRHWLQRAWTLQELRSEDITYNGGVRDSVNLWNTTGDFLGKSTTLREVMAPLWELAEHLDLDQEKSHGEIYRLVKEMSRRKASSELDKVSGLFYLLRTTSLPTYLNGTLATHAWDRCFHVLADQSKLELLFDFPYSGADGQWFPSWKQLLDWPDRDPALRRLTRQVQLHVRATTFAECTHLDTKYKRQLLLVKGLFILPNVTIKHTKVIGEYIIITSKLAGNSSSTSRTKIVEPKRIHFQKVYLTHEPIPEGLYFLMTPQPSTLLNWIVCEAFQECMVRHSALCRPTSPTECIRSLQGQIFRKVGILRTDFVISLGGPDSTLERSCECLFV